MADAFGRMVEAFHRGRLAEHPIYRRDDGRVDEAHLEGYFAEYDDWSELDRRMASASRERFSTSAVGPAEQRCGPKTGDV